MELCLKSGGKFIKVRTDSTRNCTVPNADALRVLNRCLGVCSYTHQFMTRVLYESNYRSVSEYIEEYKKDLFHWFSPVCYKDGRKYITFVFQFEHPKNQIVFGPYYGNNDGVALSNNLERAIRSLLEDVLKTKLNKFSYLNDLELFNNSLRAVLSSGYYFGCATNPIIYVPKDRAELSQILSGLDNVVVVSSLSRCTYGVMNGYINSCVLPMVSGISGYPKPLLDEGFSIIDNIYRTVYSPTNVAKIDALQGHVDNMIKLGKEIIGGDLVIRDSYCSWKLVRDDKSIVTELSKEQSYVIWMVASVIIALTLSMRDNQGYSLLIESAEAGLSAEQTDKFKEFIKEFLYINRYNKVFINK